jgi:hypothetical protein
MPSPPIPTLQELVRYGGAVVLNEPPPLTTSIGDLLNPKEFVVWFVHLCVTITSTFLVALLN